ncbi:MAG TPA: DUF2442 domain-containing protein [Rhodopila sp.]|nr:DUF2442 domain-containing protein [Rhodopila sp.]
MRACCDPAATCGCTGAGSDRLTPAAFWRSSRGVVTARCCRHDHLPQGQDRRRPRPVRGADGRTRGRAVRSQEPRATTARYDPQAARVIVDLANGCTFSFPPALTQGLEAATEEQLAEVEILGSGSALHWETLDVDLSVPELLAGLFGTKASWLGTAGRAHALCRQGGGAGEWCQRRSSSPLSQRLKPL